MATTSQFDTDYYEEILSKVDWEGGLDGFLAYGYQWIEDVPLRNLFAAVQDARAAVFQYLEDKGVDTSGV